MRRALFLWHYTGMKRLPSGVIRLARRYHEAGHELYVVGGAVRDYLLGKGISDYDFATSASPEETLKLFSRVIPTGIKHGTVTVLLSGEQFEVTTYRIDGNYGDQRRPDTVTFSSSLEEDLRRRDLTINAIALDPITGSLSDPFGGRKDLKERIIRTVGDPEERFREDSLRLLRAIRFASTLDFEIEERTYHAILRHAGDLRHPAPERIRQELEKMMRGDTPSTGWRLLRDTKLLDQIVPEFFETAGDGARSTFEGSPLQGTINSDVFAHLLRSCDCAPQVNQILRWSALLHDIGKPRCMKRDNRGIHFHKHDAVSAEMAESILGRLRFPTRMIQSVRHLIRHHMFGYSSDWTDAAVRRFIARIGRDTVFQLTALRKIDECGKTGVFHTTREIEELERRVAAILKKNEPLTVKDLAIDGRDLMETLEIPSGPTIGIVLDELLRTVIDDPHQNDRETLLEIAGRFVDDRL